MHLYASLLELQEKNTISIKAQHGKTSKNVLQRIQGKKEISQKVGKGLILIIL